MPNWCRNTLAVLGAHDALARFQTFAEGEVTYSNGSSDHLSLLFENFVPLPEALRRRGFGDHLDPQEQAEQNRIDAELTERYGYSNRRDFCFKEWGTKWQPDDVAVAGIDGGIAYDFATAWTPPVPIVIAASMRFPELRFILTYSEYMCGYRGELEYEGGEVVRHDHERWNAFAEWDEPQY
jgi:hypothetical protein